MTGFQRHDHAACIATAREAAQSLCAERGLRLTPVRLRVLEILLEAHKAVGAYDILARLAAEGRAAQPPVVYRALDFLREAGLVHKVEARNAFVACAHPGETHQPVFLICSACGNVSESAAPGGSGTLAKAARAAGFRIADPVMEAEGLCPACQDG